MLARVDAFVGERATDGVHVFMVGLFDMNQRALSRAIAIVFDGREDHGVVDRCVVIHGLPDQACERDTIRQVGGIDGNLVVVDAAGRDDGGASGGCDALEQGVCGRVAEVLSCEKT